MQFRGAYKMTAVHVAKEVNAKIALVRCMEKLDFIRTIVDCECVEGLDARANSGLKKIIEALNDDLRFASSNLD